MQAIGPAPQAQNRGGRGESVQLRTDNRKPAVGPRPHAASDQSTCRWLVNDRKVDLPIPLSSISPRALSD